MTRLLRSISAATRRRAGFVATAAVILMGTLALLWPDRPNAYGPTAVARTGPFTERLVERGTIGAAHLLLYGSTIAGAQAKILELAPEGSAVAPGDVLVRFDRAPFEEAVAREQSAVAQADAELLRAQEDLRLEQMRADTDLQAAREQLGSAESALASEQSGRGPLALAEAEVAANQAERARQQTKATSDDMHALLAQGFVTRAEVDRADQALQQALDEKRLADLRLDTLKKFERPATLDRSRAGVTAAEKGVESATEASRARLAQRRAAVTLAAERREEARARLARARDQVERTVVHSTTAGLVVYRELFFGADKRKPQPGDEVWPNQPLVAVPDPSQLVVETRVREVDLHKIAVGRSVHVSVDAYPGLSLSGSVATIGALAQEDAARAGTRFFPVTVTLTTSDDRLRTGMTARVEIEVASIASALLVPLQAVVDEDGASNCYVLTRTGPQRRPIEVTGQNALVAAVGRGLAPGDTVLLADPARPFPPGAE